MERVLLVWLNSSSESSCLNSLLSLTLRVYRMFGLIESKGESAQPLQSRQSEYLAVSPVMDYFEQLDKDERKNLNTVFMKKNLTKERIVGALGLHPLVPSL